MEFETVFPHIDEYATGVSAVRLNLLSTGGVRSADLTSDPSVAVGAAVL